MELSDENVNISSEKQVFNLPTSFSEYDYETDDLVILRIPPEPTNMPDNPQPQDDDNPQPPQETPENVENPFDDEKPNDQKEKDKDKGEGQGQGEGEGQGEGQGQGEGEGEGEDGDFGNNPQGGLDIDQIMKKIKEDFEKGMSSKDVQNKLDVEVIESALSLPKEQIKEVFKTKELAKTAIGRRNLFGTDNEVKINNALNEIFK